MGSKKINHFVKIALLPHAQSWYKYNKQRSKEFFSLSPLPQTTHYELHTFYKPISQCIKITQTTSPSSPTT